MMCVEFIKAQLPNLTVGKDLKVLDLYPCFDMLHRTNEPSNHGRAPFVSAVFFPRTHLSVAKTFWQHSGDGISSRRAEFCHQVFGEGLLSTIPRPRTSLELSVERHVMLSKGPRRYQKEKAANTDRGTPQAPLNDPSALKNEPGVERREQFRFVEERFGRNLDMSLAINAKLAIRRRIAGALTANVELEEALELTECASPGRHVHGLSEDDVYLYPTGMSSIFHIHRALLDCRGRLKSICFGYVLSPAILVSLADKVQLPLH
jgi:cystathionine gamma-synthase